MAVASNSFAREERSFSVPGFRWIALGVEHRVKALHVGRHYARLSLVFRAALQRNIDRVLQVLGCQALADS